MKLKILIFDELQYVTNLFVGRYCDGVSDQTVDMVFYSRDFLYLELWGHVVMNQAKSTAKGHCYGHVCLGYGVHVGGKDWHPEIY